MRRTLSHRSRSASGLLAGLLLLGSAGCEGGFLGEWVYEGKRPPGAEARGQETAAAPADVPHDAPDAGFVWPTAPDNPVWRLAIEAEGASGEIAIELMPALAPTTVAQVRAWAEDGFYDGTTFHRVIEGFMIQGGDPNSRDRDPKNDGRGGPGFTLDDEFSDAPFVRGVVGMGNTGRPDSTGSQFFVMHGDQPSLRGRYIVIGRVVRGMDVVDAVAGVRTDKGGRWGPADRPIDDVVMRTVAVDAPPDALAAAQSPREATADRAE